MRKEVQNNLFHVPGEEVLLEEMVVSNDLI